MASLGIQAPSVPYPRLFGNIEYLEVKVVVMPSTTHCGNGLDLYEATTRHAETLH